MSRIDETLCHCGSALGRPPHPHHYAAYEESIARWQAAEADSDPAAGHAEAAAQGTTPGQPE